VSFALETFQSNLSFKIKMQQTFIAIALLGLVSSAYCATTVPPIVSCYVCSPCPTTDGSPIVQCQPAQRYCYKEVRSDGSITRSCAVNCTSGTWTLGQTQYSVNCCNNVDGCNSATGVTPATLLGVSAALAALYVQMRRN